MRIRQTAPVAALLLLLAACTAAVPTASPSAPGTPTPSPSPTSTPAPATATAEPATPTAPPPTPAEAPATPTQQPTEEATEAPGGTTESVAVVDFRFEPRALEISSGTQVTWTNQGNAPHTVTFDGGPDSGVLASGDTYDRTFDEAGTFEYICTIHPSMIGTITVTE